MAGLNRIILIGNLGRDVEMRFTPSGKPVANFSLAVSEQKDQTEWFKITAWGKTAEICNQYLAKGSQVCIEGRVKLETWDSDDGERSSLAVTANRVVFLSKQSGSREESNEDYEIPF